MNVNNLVAEVTEMMSGVKMDTEYEAPVTTTVREKVLGDKEMQEQLNDAWYVKHRGIAYNFGAAGINVIGEEE